MNTTPSQADAKIDLPLWATQPNPYPQGTDEWMLQEEAVHNAKHRAENPAEYAGAAPVDPNEPTAVVPDCNLPKLEEQIAKLNKRATKLGVGHITLRREAGDVLHEFIKIDANNEDVRQTFYAPILGTMQGMIPGGYCVKATGRILQMWKIWVDGVTPRYAGWAFAATLEPLTLEDGKTENLLQCVPGFEVPYSFKNRIGHCDHCHTKRARRQTFIVQNIEKGDYRMVGRDCIKDFLGHADPSALAKWAEMLADFNSGLAGAEEPERGGMGGRCAPDAWGTDSFLAVVAVVIRKHGWMSRGGVREASAASRATADITLELLTPPWPNTQENQAKYEAQLAEYATGLADEVLAEEAIDWARNIPQADIEKNNYLANINTVARSAGVSRTTAGLAASIVSAYQREQGKIVERKAQTAAEAVRENGHVGVLGKRAEFTVECGDIYPKEGEFGTTGIHRMYDEKGNVLKWFASESAGWLTVGKKYIVKGTPKEHGEYKGRKETVLQRVAIVKELESVAVATK